MDIVILGAALTLIRWSVGSEIWLSLKWGPDFVRWIPVADFGLNNIIYFLYWMMMEGIYSHSIGKMIIR